MYLICFQQCMMSFGDEKLATALASLKDTEKIREIPTGFPKGVKKKNKRKEVSTCSVAIIVSPPCLLMTLDMPDMWFENKCFRKTICAIYVKLC